MNWSKRPYIVSFAIIMHEYFLQRTYPFLKVVTSDIFILHCCLAWLDTYASKIGKCELTRTPHNLPCKQKWTIMLLWFLSFVIIIKGGSMFSGIKWPFSTFWMHQWIFLVNRWSFCEHQSKIFLYLQEGAFNFVQKTSCYFLQLVIPLAFHVYCDASINIVAIGQIYFDIMAKLCFQQNKKSRLIL